MKPESKARQPFRPLGKAAVVIGMLVCAWLLPAQADSGNALAALQGKGVLAGASHRPFPMLMPLDYSYCRSEAWLAALDAASRGLPTLVITRLRELDADSRLGRLALCALLYPVDVVTPEISASSEIKVYLDNSRDERAAVNGILRDNESFVLEMCLIAELEETLRELKAIWPKSVASARERIPQLETVSIQLDGIWQALALNASEKKRASPLSDFAEAASRARKSAVAQVMLAAALLEAQRHQSVLETASLAAQLCQERQAACKDANEGCSWNLLAAKALHIRGMAHWKLGQLALAEADFDAAIRLLENVGQKGGQWPEALLARGALRGLRRNGGGMCQDFEKACALGQCQGLAQARRQGQCLGLKQ